MPRAWDCSLGSAFVYLQIRCWLVPGSIELLQRGSSERSWVISNVRQRKELRGTSRNMIACVLLLLVLSSRLARPQLSLLGSRYTWISKGMSIRWRCLPQHTRALSSCLRNTGTPTNARLFYVTCLAPVSKTWYPSSF